MTVREHPEATPHVNALIKYLRENGESEPAAHWLALIRGCFRAGKTEIRGGMSGWFKYHNQGRVEALSASFSPSGALLELELGEERTVGWNPLGVRFFTSMDQWTNRRFRGVLLIALSEDTFVGFDRDFLQVVAYHSVGDPQKV